MVSGCTALAGIDCGATVIRLAYGHISFAYQLRSVGMTGFVTVEKPEGQTDHFTIENGSQEEIGWCMFVALHIMWPGLLQGLD